MSRSPSLLWVFLVLSFGQLLAFRQPILHKSSCGSTRLFDIHAAPSTESDSEVLPANILKVAPPGSYLPKSSNGTTKTRESDTVSQNMFSTFSNFSKAMNPASLYPKPSNETTKKQDTVSQMMDGMQFSISNAMKLPQESLGLLSTTGSNSTATDKPVVKKEFVDLKARVDKIEKQLFVKKRTDVSIQQLALNPKTVERCSILAFFCIGTILGASLLDRLWLVGGIFMGYWASDTVNRDTQAGFLCRRVGAEVVQYIRDAQEKYNQAVMFYNTGKLAYYSSKTWEVYDKKYGIQNKVDKMKQLTTLRAAQFSSSIENLDEYGLSYISDFWNAMQTAPTKVKSLDKQYGLTRKIAGYGKTVLSSSGTVVLGAARGVRGLWSSSDSSSSSNSRGRARGSSNSKSSSSRKKAKNSITAEEGGFLAQLSSIFSGESEKDRQHRNRRGNLINPWSNPFDTVRFN